MAVTESPVAPVGREPERARSGYDEREPARTRREPEGARAAQEGILRRQSARESAARTYARALPIVPVRARGLTIEGADGRRYLDCLSGAGTLALGHNHPVVLEAIREVLDSGAPLHVLDLATPVKDAFTTELFRTLPAGLADHARVQFCGPAGTDAVEAAFTVVRAATGRTGMLAFNGLAERAETLGARMLTQLRALADEFVCVGDVRGRGLMIGIEMVTPDAAPSKDAMAPLPPAPSLATAVRQECLRRGLIVGLGGRHAGVVHLLPPLTITDEQANAVLDRLSDAVASVAAAVESRGPGSPTPERTGSPGRLPGG